jgi:hypothetical protein
MVWVGIWGRKGVCVVRKTTPTLGEITIVKNAQNTPCHSVLKEQDIKG